MLETKYVGNFEMRIQSPTRRDWKVPDIEFDRFGEWTVIFVPIEVALKNWSQCSRILGFPTSAILNWLSFSKNRPIDRPFSDKYLISFKFGSFREKVPT